MNMKIGTNVYKQYIASGSSGNRIASKIIGGSCNRSAIKQDSLSFSAEAALLKESAKTVRSYAAQISNPASDDRINALKEKIKNGEYSISAQQVADSILNRRI